MPTATRVVTRIQDQDDAAVAPLSADVNGYTLLYDHATQQFVLGNAKSIAGPWTVEQSAVEGPHYIADTRASADGDLVLNEITGTHGAANTAKLYARDNGAGKTLLCVKLGDNVEIVLATQA